MKIIGKLIWNRVGCDRIGYNTIQYEKIGRNTIEYDAVEWNTISKIELLVDKLRRFSIVNSIFILFLIISIFSYLFHFLLISFPSYFILTFVLLLQIFYLGDDQNLKRVAEGFSKEFLICKEQIETQLNKLL